MIYLIWRGGQRFHLNLVTLMLARRISSFLCLGNLLVWIASTSWFEDSWIPQMKKCVLVTGGAGFLGSGFIRHIGAQTNYDVINVDKLTYAANEAAIGDFRTDNRYSMYREDICNTSKMLEILRRHQPDVVINFAAETHVDRSIDKPSPFLETNISGTASMLEATTAYRSEKHDDHGSGIRFIQISTDEVFGALGQSGHFNEDSPYQPNSPYSASKAAADHLVRAWHKTYGLPIVIAAFSNTYGPNQFPEKLIPTVISKCLTQQPIPVYGNGENIRDWLYAEDQAYAVECVMEKGEIGEMYCVGTSTEKSNLAMVRDICAILDELQPSPSGQPYDTLITFVTDRPGHDFRYAIDSSKIRDQLGWEPQTSFSNGLAKTVQWYIDNPDRLANLTDMNYHGERLGLERFVPKTK